MKILIKYSNEDLDPMIAGFVFLLLITNIEVEFVERRKYFPTVPILREHSKLPRQDRGVIPPQYRVKHKRK